MKRFLGKPVRSYYGGFEGSLVSLSPDAKNEVADVEIEHGNSYFEKYPINQITINSEYLVFVPSWKVQADELKRQFDLTSKRIKALNELRSEGEIHEDLYSELWKQHETLHSEIRDTQQTLIKNLSEISQRLTSQIKELQICLTNNKMQRAAGEIDEESYRATNESIKAGLKKASLERADLENTLDYLMKLEVSQQATVEAPTEPSKEPSDLIVVKLLD